MKPSCVRTRPPFSTHKPCTHQPETGDGAYLGAKDTGKNVTRKAFQAEKEIWAQAGVPIGEVSFLPGGIGSYLAKLISVETATAGFGRLSGQPFGSRCLGFAGAASGESALDTFLRLCSILR